MLSNATIVKRSRGFNARNRTILAIACGVERLRNNRWFARFSGCGVARHGPAAAIPPRVDSGDKDEP
jgi:hypothetical protein